MHGYSGSMLNVDLRSGQVTIETFDEAFARDYLGGKWFCNPTALRASGTWY